MRYIKKYKLTKGYSYNKDDIVIIYDNYLCIIQTRMCDNIIFLKLCNKHKNSLRKDVEFIIKHAITVYGRQLFMINNRRWKALLDKIQLVKQLYDNEEYIIYGKREDIH